MAAFFQRLDQLRRLQGRIADAAGLGPVETPWQAAGTWPGVRLREYRPSGAGGDGPVVLIVPAPIKRAYIWDLMPGASAVRRFLDAGMRVHLAEWTRPGPGEHRFGLDEYAHRLIARCLDEIARRTGEERAVLAGHSLGGTLGAIFAAREPERVAGLVLIEAPTRFGSGAGALAPLVGGSPPAPMLPGSGRAVPGSLIGLASTLAAPVTFQIERQADLVASLGDRRALETHLRVARWQLDEFPMPGSLFRDVLERLYRTDEFMRGRLVVGRRQVSPSDVRAPLLQVVNPASRVIPPTATLPFQSAAAGDPKHLLWYHGDRGVSLQHVGALVGRNAHRDLWPEIVGWVREVAR
jgi:polyhydroxyalkanoate synthase subunit PhaC